jgi:hypothetical protein
MFQRVSADKTERAEDALIEDFQNLCYSVRGQHAPDVIGLRGRRRKEKRDERNQGEGKKLHQDVWAKITVALQLRKVPIADRKNSEQQKKR